MKNILLTTAMTISIVSNNFEQIKSSESIIFNNKSNEKINQKKLFFKYSFDNSKLDAIYGIVKNEFNAIPNLQENKIVYQLENEEYSLIIKIKSNRIILKYSSSNSDENQISGKIERIKENIKALK